MKDTSTRSQQFEIMKKHLSFDVVVVGGGMAGTIAAISAARRGAKTALIQDRPMLGGNASSEVRMHICGAHGRDHKEAGILEEIQLSNMYYNQAGHYSVWDHLLYEQAAFQSELELFLNSSCTGVEVENAHGAIRLLAVHAWQLTTQIQYTFEAKNFIDCSGDSILAVNSGALFRAGREGKNEFHEDIAPNQPDSKTMGNSILLQFRKTKHLQKFTPPRSAYMFENAEDLPRQMSIKKCHNFWWVEIGGLKDTIKDAEGISLELKRTIWGIYDYIKNRAPDAEEAANMTLEWIGSLPGKRENRRYIGKHILTQNDLRSGGNFEDTVAYGGWSMDDHHPAGIYYPGKPTLFHKAPSGYGIPFSCLISSNVENLMFAGRNISATHAALSSTRVMATCAIIGQAVGTAAAIATKSGKSGPALGKREIQLLQEQLLEDDCWLPGRTRSLTDQGQQGSQELDPVLRNTKERYSGEETNALDLEYNKEVTLKWSSPQNIEGLRMVLDSDLRNRKKMPCHYDDQHSTVYQMPRHLLKSFEIQGQLSSGSWETLHQENSNHKRLVCLPVKRELKAIKLIPKEGWHTDHPSRLFSIDTMKTIPNGSTLGQSRTTWKKAVDLAKLSPKDLSPPDSGLESATRNNTGISA